MSAEFEAPSDVGSVIGTDGNRYPVTNGEVTMPVNAVPSGGMFAAGYAKPGTGGGGLPLKNAHGDNVVALDGNDNVFLQGYDGNHVAQASLGFDADGSASLTQPSAVACTGTVTKGDFSLALVGTGTLFLTELGIGYRLAIDGKDYFVTAIASNIAATVDTFGGFTDASFTATRPPFSANSGLAMLAAGSNARFSTLQLGDEPVGSSTFWQNYNGGGYAQGFALGYNRSITDLSGTKFYGENGANFVVQATAADDAATLLTNINAQLITLGTKNYSEVYGLNCNVQHSGTGRADFLVANENLVLGNAPDGSPGTQAGSAGVMISNYGGAEWSLTGTCDEAYGCQFSVDAQSGTLTKSAVYSGLLLSHGGALVNCNGFELAAATLSGGGSFGTIIGFYCADQSAASPTTGFAFRSDWDAPVYSKGAVMVAKNAAPADASLAAGEMAIWFDDTNGASALMIKAKQADGTVKTGTVAVTT